jgi:hypothetical protein
MKWTRLLTVLFGLPLAAACGVGCTHRTPAVVKDLGSQTSDGQGDRARGVDLPATTDNATNRGEPKASPTLKAGSKSIPGQHALLVGVTRYPGLGKHLELEGGAGDVLLMRELLETKFRFPPENITILSEEEGEKDPGRRPEKKNIKRECERLAGKVKEGEKVVVLLSGHGSRQPEKPGVKDPQPDGYDKIFLPRDVRDWDHNEGAVPNAISGRELGDWLHRIPQNKALLWVIVDACHSGQMLRGAREKACQVDPEKGLKVPPKAIREAEVRGKKLGVRTRSGEPEPPIRVPLARQPGVVLLYACQSSQVTVEGRYAHPETGAERPYGLLTHTINCILRGATAPLTYRELMARVRSEYTSQDRDFPTPVIEGPEQNTIILGGARAAARPALLLSRTGEKLTVNAGQLHGLTRDTILAVYPPPGVEGGLQGHVRVSRVMPVRAVVEPTEHAKVKAPAEKDIVGGKCEVVEIAYDNMMRLSVAIDHAGSRPKAGELERLAKDLAALAEKQNSPFTFVTDPKQAKWLVRLDEGKVYILPSLEWEDERNKEEAPRLLGPADNNATLAGWLKESFARIIRARNLLNLAKTTANQGMAGNLDFQARVEVQAARAGEKPAARGAAQTTRTLYQGDELKVRVRNTGKVPVDVTVLWVNSKFGIEPLFPVNEYPGTSAGLCRWHPASGAASSPGRRPGPSRPSAAPPTSPPGTAEVPTSRRQCPTRAGSGNR